MKKTLNFFVVLVVILSVSSCKKLADVDLSKTIIEKIPVHINQTSGAAEIFNREKLLSLLSADNQEYADKLTDVTINSLKFKLVEFTGDPAGTLTGSLKMGTYTLNTNTDINVKNTVDAATVFTVSDASALASIATILLNDNQISASYEGTALCEAQGMDFKVEIIMDVEVTANALE